MKKPKINRQKLKKIAIFSTVAIVLLLSSFGVYSYTYSKKVYPHQFIGQANISGLTKQALVDKIESEAKSFSNVTITIKNVDKNREYPIKTSDIAVKYDVAGTIDQVWQTGRNKNVWVAMKEQFKSLFVKKKFVAKYSYDGALLNTKITAIATELDQPEKDYSLSYSGGKFALLTDRENGKRIDQAEIIAKIVSQLENIKSEDFSFGLKSYSPQISEASANQALVDANKILDTGTLTLKSSSSSLVMDRDTIGGLIISVGNGSNLNIALNQDKVTSYVADLANKINVVPADAKLTVTDGKVAVFQPSQAGKTLDQNQVRADIQNVLFARFDGNSSKIDTLNLTLKIATTNPVVASDTISQYGLQELIGSGTTDFSGSPSNRITNITVGAGKINGYLVKPGEEFSTVKTLSPIDQAHGYVSGLVISNGKTFPADGGGLCQVSTTLFRAVLNAGLTVTARTPHSYEVSYYQRGVGPGLDATIFDPNPDFKWVNDTGHYIFIQSVIKGKTLTFNMYGTSDGRVSKIDGPTTLSTSDPSGDPIYVQSDTIAPGEIHQIDPPVPGAKTTVSYTVTRAGAVINKQTFNSDYKAMPAQYLYGVGAVLPGQTIPAVVETPPPTPVLTPTCTDGAQNGTETGVDCGGSCGACPTT